MLRQFGAHQQAAVAAAFNRQARRSGRSGKNTAVLQIADGWEALEVGWPGMSCSDPVNLVYEPDLPDHIALCWPADLTLPDHVD